MVSCKGTNQAMDGDIGISARNGRVYDIGRLSQSRRDAGSDGFR
ncbi:hypothetical protein RB8342 [Rhodopirellula baltica SH 1]|uniref:Uncharacterized protein n=1 Tax=Rhodopirellula baltica (strain DSM 10527 / NCIMB 13988 / SH1) TaxID=243090 RepID=Q7UFU1_RHOBA|nr:hypothetical protein RB8342 [Rhodopirellula baltica SH 1]